MVNIFRFMVVRHQVFGEVSPGSLIDASYKCSVDFHCLCSDITQIVQLLFCVDKSNALMNRVFHFCNLHVVLDVFDVRTSVSLSNCSMLVNYLSGAHTRRFRRADLVKKIAVHVPGRGVEGISIL